jgi:hypothetical protein
MPGQSHEYRPAGQEGFAAEIRLLLDLPPRNPPHSPLVRGEVGWQPFSFNSRVIHAIALSIMRRLFCFIILFIIFPEYFQ